MAEKLLAPSSTGLSNPKFVLIRVSDGAYWSTAGTPAFEAYSAGNIANYGIAATETGSTGQYSVTNPAEGTRVKALLVASAGASLAVSDLASNVVFEDFYGPTDEAMELQRELLGGTTGRSPGWSIRSDELPEAFNLEILAPLRWGKFNVLMLSDSTGNMVVQYRARYGFMRAFLDLPFNRIYVPPICSAESEGYQTFNRPTVTIASGAAIGDGSSTNDSALQMGVVPFSSNEATVIHQTWLRSLADYGANLGLPIRHRGDPFINKRLKCSLLYRKTAAGTNLTGVGVTANRDGSGAVFTSRDLSTALAGHSEVDIPLPAPTSSAATSIRLIYESGAENETGKFFAYNGHVFYVDDPCGLSYTAVSEGGWKTWHHLSPSDTGDDAAYYNANGVYTQARALTTLIQAGWPTVIMISLGINLTTVQTAQDATAKAEYKAHLKLIIARFKAIYTAAGRTLPRFWLVAPHQSADGASNRQWAVFRAEACYECALEDMTYVGYSSVHHYMLRTRGDYVQWVGTLSDDLVHFNAAGELHRWTGLGQHVRDATAPAMMATFAMSQARKLLVDPTPAPSAVGTDSYADRTWNKDGSGTYNPLTDSQEALAEAAAAVKAKTDLLPASFPNNFSELLIDGDGQVTAAAGGGPTTDKVVIQQDGVQIG